MEGAGLRADIVTLHLTVENLCVERGDREVLAGVTFAVPGGQALVLTGANGSGKTTLLRAIAGLLPAAGGRVALGGGDAERTVGEQCHYVGHKNAIKGSLTVLENARFWAGYLGAADGDRLSRVRSGANVGDRSARESEGRAEGGTAWRTLEPQWPAPGFPPAHKAEGGRTGDTAIVEALERFDLDALAEIPAAYLSAGQMRRLALARLLLAPRPLWLLDEPMTALDAASGGRVAEIMNAHLAQGGIVVAATHAPLGVEPAGVLRLANGVTGATGDEAAAGTGPASPTSGPSA